MELFPQFAELVKMDGSFVLPIAYKKNLDLQAPTSYGAICHMSFVFY